MLNVLLENELEEVNQGFKVTDLESATWCFKKKLVIEKQRAEFKALAEKEITRINDWLNSETAKLENQEMFFDGLLTEYALEQRKLDPKWKLSSPYGKLSFRKQQPKWNYDEALVDWLYVNENELVRIKKEVDKTALKKATKVINNQVYSAETGELIPFVTVEEQPEAIKIEVKL